MSLTREHIEDLCEDAIGLNARWTRAMAEQLRDMALRSLESKRLPDHGTYCFHGFLKGERCPHCDKESAGQVSAIEPQSVIGVERSFDAHASEDVATPKVTVYFRLDDWAARDSFAWKLKYPPQSAPPEARDTEFICPKCGIRRDAHQCQSSDGGF